MNPNEFESTKEPLEGSAPVGRTDLDDVHVDRPRGSLALDHELASKLSLVTEPRLDRYSWLEQVLGQAALTINPDGNGDFNQFYLEPGSRESATAFQEAFRQVGTLPDWFPTNFVRLFCGVPGHAHRPHPMEEMYDDMPKTPDPGQQNIFRCYFRGSPLLRQSGGYPLIDERYVRYDPRRMFSGLAMLERNLQELGEGSPLLSDICDTIARFRSDELCSQVADLVRAETGLSVDIQDPYVEEWVDCFSGRAYNDISMGEGAHLGSLHRDGYIYFPDGSQDQFFSSDGKFQEPTYLAGKIAALCRDSKEEIDGLESALRRFEYVYSWTQLVGKSPAGTMCLPTLGPPQSDLVIKGGRPPALVTSPETVEEVIPNDLSLTAERPLLWLMGGNGRGKSQTFSMATNNVHAAHQGTPTFAESCTAPEGAQLVFQINESTHSDTASAFQNEMKALARFFDQLDSGVNPQDAIGFFDELGRGTDIRDGGALVWGVSKALAERGAKAAFATHFNYLGQLALDESSGDFALPVQVATMDEHHKLQPGIGRSYGIDAADTVGLHKEIVGIARQVEEQADSDKMSFDTPSVDVGEPTPYKPLILTGLQELSLVSHNQGNTRRKTHLNVGKASAVFAAHSPLRRNTGEVYDWQFEQIHEDYADMFMHELLITPTGEEKQARQDCIQTMIDTDHQDLDKALSGLRSIGSVLDLRNTRLRKDYDRQMIRACQEYSEQHSWLEITEHVRAIQFIGQQIQALGLDSLDPRLASFQTLASSESLSDLDQFVSRNSHLLPNRGGVTEEEVRRNWELYRELSLLLGKCQGTLSKIQQRVGIINFYATVANTVVEQGWCEADNNAPAGTFHLKDALNLQLAAELGLEDVTTLDIDLNDPSTVNVITGTNGGGKTKLLELLGLFAHLKESINYVPAASAKMGDLSFLGVHIAGSQHSDARSSFQDEVKRIQGIIEAFEEAGSPSGGVILIDEPFKGTSEEDAVPLLIGLMKYFQEREVKLVFTTHFSGLFEYLNRTDEAQRPKVEPIFVDYFSEEERYKIKPGIGQSSGIRVAEEMGLPEDVIRYAREFLERFSDRIAA